MRVYTFKVTVTEEEVSPFWDGVRQYETPTNRWVKSQLEDNISKGELMDYTVEEIEVKDV
jgi:hypothetical protein